MVGESDFIYDLFSALRKDPKRATLVTEAIQRVDRVAEAFSHGKAARSDITAAEAALVPLCGFNFGLLIPKFFPRYPIDKPLDFSSRPFMFVMTTMAPGSVVTLKAGRQVGKCADGDTVLATNEGNLTMRDVFEMGEPCQRSTLL